jgi:uridine kinase
MMKYFFCLALFFIQNLCAKDKIILGIAGGTGSGKTTLACKIQKHFQECCILISQDSYYRDLSALTPEARDRVNFDHPDSLDFILLKQNLLDLKNNKAIYKPVYNFHSHTRETVQEKIEPTQLIIVEGILLFSIPEIRELFDIKVFIDISDDVRLLRRIERDINERGRDFISVKNQYLTTVKPMHDMFVEPSKKFADLIVPHGGENITALSLIVSKLNEEIEMKKGLQRSFFEN